MSRCCAMILKESGINPDKVTISQFATDKIGEMARDQSIDAFMAVGPLKSKITVDAIAATAAARGEPKFLPIDVADAIAKKNPIYESEEIPASIFGSSPAAARRQGRYGRRQPPDHCAEVVVGHGGRRLRPPALHQPPATGAGNADRLADRKARYRQGRRVAGACGRSRLYRRQRAHVPREIHRLHLVRGPGALGPGIGRRLAAGITGTRTSASSTSPIATICSS